MKMQNREKVVGSRTAQWKKRWRRTIYVYRSLAMTQAHLHA